MKIVFYANTYLPYISGVVRSMQFFREGLTARGQHVAIVAQGVPGYHAHDPQVVRFPAIPVPLYRSLALPVPLSFTHWRFINHFQPDVIHSQHPFILGDTAARTARQRGIPLIYTFHTQYHHYGSYVALPGWLISWLLFPLLRRMLRRYLKQCAHVIFPSASMLAEVQHFYGLERPYTVLPTGVNTANFANLDGRAVRNQRGWEAYRLLISVGRLGPEKNWETVLHAAAQLLPTSPDLRLVLVGDGPQRAALADLAANLGIAAQVIFVGQVEFETVPGLLAAAADSRGLFLFASQTESQGLATLEALAAGLPVAAVRGAGTIDIVRDGQEGYLTDPNPQALAAAARQLLTSPENWMNFQRQARQRAQDYDMMTLAEQLEGVYTQALLERKKMD